MLNPLRPARWHGHTLLEATLAIALFALLAMLALPSLRAQIDKSRRADAIATLFQAQLAQERWRANQPAYGTLADIGMPAQSPAGHYTISVTAASATGYELVASARGVQARDAACRHLRLAMVGAHLTQSSGPDPAMANPDGVNRRCWSL